MFRSLGDAMMSAIEKGMVDTGEAGIAVPAGSRKKTASAKPAAKFQGGIKQSGGTTSPPTIGRSITTASPTRRPSSAVVIDLVMYRDEVGRRAGGGNRPASVRRNAPGSELRGTVLEFVGRAGARVAGTVPVHSSSPMAGAIPMADR